MQSFNLNIKITASASMNKVLFEEDNGQQELLSPVCTQQAAQKKPRPKFTLLDDIDELNEIINGPGANEQNIKTQQMLQKNYQYMKSQDSGLENHGEGNPARSRNTYKESRKREENRDDQKQNRDVVNLSKFEGPELVDELRNVKGPRIIVTMKRIDLLKEANSSDFYVRGLENLVTYETSNDGTRAPTNSMRENEETLLFTRALQETERNKASSQSAQHQFKGHKSSQPNYKRC